MVSARGSVAVVEEQPHRPWIIAHRGASAVRRENTLAAFVQAAELGADAVEFDVRRTADGHLVVHHDAAIPEVGVIVQMSRDEIAARAPWVPELSEAIEACNGMWMNIEIKNSPFDPDWDPGETVVEAVLEHLALTHQADRVLISSFNPGTAARAAGRLPGLQTGLLTDQAIDPLSSVAPAAAAGHATINPHVETLRGENAAKLVGLAAADHLGVVPWTVDDPDEITRLADAGVAGIITNVPDAAVRALQGW